MKPILLIVSFLFTVSGFADNIILENLTPYPQDNPISKIAIQWANNAKQIEKENQALIHGTKLNPNTIQPVTQQGKVQVAIPKRAEYFRILVWSQWSQENVEPDLITNWLDIIPNKTYTLRPDQLMPSVLLSGMGC